MRPENKESDNLYANIKAKTEAFMLYLFIKAPLCHLLCFPVPWIYLSFSTWCHCYCCLHLLE